MCKVSGMDDNRGVLINISMAVMKMKTHSGPKRSHMKPPIIGAGILAIPVHKPINPLHLPIQSAGTSSGVMEP